MGLEICPRPWGVVGGKNVIFSKSKVPYHVELQLQTYHHRVQRTHKPPTRQNFDFEKFAPGVRGGGGVGQKLFKVCHVTYQNFHLDGTNAVSALTTEFQVTCSPQRRKTEIMASDTHFFRFSPLGATSDLKFGCQCRNCICAVKLKTLICHMTYFEQLCLNKLNFLFYFQGYIVYEGY